MLALQISVNGQTLATAGTVGSTAVNLNISAFGEELRLAKPGHGPVVLRLGGLSEDGAGVRRGLLTWIEERGYAVGDEIVIRVVEVQDDGVSIPTRTALPDDVARMLVPRSSFTHWVAKLFTKKEKSNVN